LSAGGWFMGGALAAFGMMQQITSEPLLKKLLRYVMSDEARRHRLDSAHAAVRSWLFGFQRARR
jgi:hypothetical protein